MINAYWGMEYNPFSKYTPLNKAFESVDFTQSTFRLEHLKKIKGIGLFTGSSGCGKTFVMKNFASKLNPSMYKVVYLPLSTVTVMEFYRSLAYGLNLEPSPKKIDLFKSIQERIAYLYKDKKTVTVIILDESQYLKTEVLRDLKMALNFDMDSIDYAVLILMGQQVLNDILEKSVHESLKQRISVKYSFQGLSKTEMIDYVETRLKLAGVSEKIFNENSLEALYSCSNGSTRKLNSLGEKCLMIAAQRKIRTIDTEVVMLAQNEIELA